MQIDKYKMNYRRLLVTFEVSKKDAFYEAIILHSVLTVPSDIFIGYGIDKENAINELKTMFALRYGIKQDAVRMREIKPRKK